jgi:hypothetical protein
MQSWYNTQAGRSLDITSNYWIDAQLVEGCLADHPIASVDTQEYTIYFINWYGRPDFKFHVYTKTDEPDVDTGYNWGLLKNGEKMLGWGGTTTDDPQSPLPSLRRIWFYEPCRPGRI